ncbi:MAG: DNA polymerase III subunit beta [Planctomycetota bacterium]
MKIRLPRQELQDALAAIHLLAGGRTTKPILACVKLTASEEQLELCATDGEAALRMNVPALTTEEPGETVVAADRFLGIIRELGDVEILLEVDERQCTIRAAGGEFKIYVQAVADFPPVPEFGGDPDLVVEGRALQRMTNLTLYAAARETSRYAINGVMWNKRDKKLFAVATDGRRMARAGVALLTSDSADFEVIVPTKALNVFERVFTAARGADDVNVEIRITPNQLLMRWPGCVLATALVEGRFPKHEDVIPKESNKDALLDRAEFYTAVRQASLLTTEDSRAVRLAFGPEKLVISSQSPEQGEARIEIPVEYQGEPLEIGFNPSFLVDALRVIPFEQVHIELHESFRPGVLCGADKNDFLYVVMPVSLAP